MRTVSAVGEVDYVALAGLKEKSFLYLTSVLVLTISRSHVETCPDKDCLPPEKSPYFETSKRSPLPLVGCPLFADDC